MDTVSFTHAGEHYELELTEEFVRTINEIEHTSDNFFVTGKAGTGKSMLLKYYYEHTAKNVVILAPTGLSALNVGGQTIHSFFRMPPQLIQKHELGFFAKVRKMVRYLDAIIIDEISMVRADVLDGIDHLLRGYMNKNIPFGGMQMIFFGDLFQLPPIVNQGLTDYFNQLYGTPYFFSSKVMEQIPLRTLKLETIHRQKDEKFIHLLNNIREGNYLDDTVEELNERSLFETSNEDQNAVILTGTNSGAKRYNDKYLAAINEKVVTYEAKVKGRVKEDGPYIRSLEIKIGARVMLIRNDPNGKWVNGDFGTVVGLEEKRILIEIGEEIHKIKRERWEFIEYKTSKEGEEISVDQDVVGVVEQFPIKPGWAITIHKSQGQTFDSIILDIGRGTFAYGQLYVALSRARTLEGIYLQRYLRPTDVLVDDRLVEAERTLLSNS